MTRGKKQFINSSLKKISDMSTWKLNPHRSGKEGKRTWFNLFSANRKQIHMAFISPAHEMGWRATSVRNMFYVKLIRRVNIRHNLFLFKGRQTPSSIYFSGGAEKKALINLPYNLKAFRSKIYICFLSRVTEAWNGVSCPAAFSGNAIYSVYLFGWGSRRIVEKLYILPADSEWCGSNCERKTGKCFPAEKT